MWLVADNWSCIEIIKWKKLEYECYNMEFDLNEVGKQELL